MFSVKILLTIKLVTKTQVPKKWDWVARIALPLITEFFLTGIFVVPNDAVKAVRDHADLILSKDGGKGAIRELSELILKNHVSYKKNIKNGWIGIN